MCVHAQSCLTLSTGAVADGCACVCVCVCVCECAQSCPTLHQSSGIWVCVLNRVQHFALEQWHMGVCVCMHVHAQSYLTLYQSGGIWGCVCVCVPAQSCLILCSEAVAYGSVHVCVCVCVHVRYVTSDSAPEQWCMVVFLPYL